MRTPLRTCLLVLLFSLSFSGFGQKHYSVKSRKAIHYYEMAGQFYQNRDLQAAYDQLLLAQKAAPNFIESYLFQADVLNRMGRTQEEIECYRKAIAIDGTFFPRVHFNLGNAYLKIGEYRKAVQQYNDFLSFPNITKRNQSMAQHSIKNCQFALLMMENPVDFNPIGVGDGINTAADEYWPCLTADESMMIFTRLCPKPGGNEMKVKQQEDFWISIRDEQSWRPAQSLSETINTVNNEGAQTITADGRMMYFTACNRPDGMGRCDIYYSEKIGNNWSTPKNLGKPVNSAAWDAQPSISADGRTLYFVSNRKSGKGKMDIWQSHLIEILANGKQRWSAPINLSINTRDNEMSPFIHASNEYLIFASDGRMGMGGFDLFKTTKTTEGKWSKPENMGYPINTFGDEIGLIINAKADKAYFSSDRIPGKGKDIFRFDLPQRLQPPKVSWLRGRVFDANSQKSLCAELQLIDLNRGDTVAQLYSDRISGEFMICLPAGKEYLLNAKCENYLIYSDHFEMQAGKAKTLPQQLDVPLQFLQAGNEFVLRNIFYAVDSWEILPKSEIELNILLRLLNENANLRIEVGGHTDSTGTPDHNRELSEKRAKSVCDYLVKHGIAANRLQFKGYGAEKPIADNSSAEGRAKNRRTEITILE